MIRKLTEVKKKCIFREMILFENIPGFLRAEWDSPDL